MRLKATAAGLSLGIPGTSPARGAVNLVEGNLIGTDLSGTLALPNAADGVDVGGAGNTLGGTAAACGIAYEIARGLGWFGLLMGVRPRGARLWKPARRAAWTQEPALEHDGVGRTA